ncbi:MAG: NUDIX hydrolase [Acidimicrobiales bacterium]
MTDAPQPDLLDDDPGSERAAGGVIIRTKSELEEVCLVFRPHHNDWSLPKGKLDPGENFLEAALREVYEETGLRCRELQHLGSTRYEIERPPFRKLVHYWTMEIVEDAIFVPNEEISELVWMGFAEAKKFVSYPHDAEILTRAENASS